MRSPLVTFIIGTYDRPKHLRHLLACLQLQTHENWIALVMDEATEPDAIATTTAPVNWAVVNDTKDSRISWSACGPRRGDWHQTVKAEAITATDADYLVFPADDVYYTPVFLERFLQAARQTNAELLYCDWLYDLQGYIPWRVQPRVGHIDIGGFMVSKDAATRVPWTTRGQTGDGKWIEALVGSGLTHARVPGVHYVKN